MGECYSKPSPSSSQDILPNMTSEANGKPSKLLRPKAKPSKIQNSNEQIPNERQALSVLDDKQSSPGRKSGTIMSRFGFRKSKSSHSKLDNSSSSQPKRTPSVRKEADGKCHNVSYSPKDEDSWLMIDDDSGVHVKEENRLATAETLTKKLENDLEILNSSDNTQRDITRKNGRLGSLKNGSKNHSVSNVCTGQENRLDESHATISLPPSNHPSVRKGMRLPRFFSEGWGKAIAAGEGSWKKGSVQETKQGSREVAEGCETSKTQTNKAFVEQAEKYPLISELSTEAPIAVIDSLEATSVGSLHSDDLMLDLEINLDDHDQSSIGGGDSYVRRERSRSSGTGESMLSYQSARQTRSLYGRNSTGNVLPRRHGSYGRGDRMGKSLANESIKELSFMIDGRRHQSRVSSTERPASFPGPPQNSGDASTPDHVVAALKPPRTSSSIADDEQVVIEGFVYRGMLQEITMLKTALLKLKRCIQEDDLGCPFTPGLMNGLRLCSSQPSSPEAPEISGISLPSLIT